MDDVNNKKKIKKKKRVLNKILTLLLLIMIIILFGTVLYLNIIPIKYTILIFLLTISITLLLVLCNFSKKKGFRIIGYFFSIIIISITLFLEIYLINTLGFLMTVTKGSYLIKNYNLVVLNDSNYKSIKDLNNKNIGIYNIDDVIKELQKKINKKIDVKYEEYDSKEELINNLLTSKIDSIILEDNELSLLKENDNDLYNKLKSIDNIKIKNDISNIKDAIDINKDSFNIYISGIDTYGNINEVSRSDVNILVTVNPKSEKILITWIPRDYFVDINKGVNDKLTHAGMYGIDTSIEAIERLLDVNINYYLKVNFTSVIKVVDLLKGIEVYNDETFTTNENITFKKGNITLNGEEALSFVRDRKHVTGGDIGRGRNQIKVLEALINKVLSKDLLKNYNKLLKSLDGSFITNIDQSTIFSFIKRELIKRRNWQIESVILNGTDGREYTYSVPSQTLYVMMPDENMVNSTKEDIRKVLDGD